MANNIKLIEPGTDFKSVPIFTALFLFAVIMLSFPIRDLAADYYYRQAPRILDDKATEGLDTAPITEKSMPAYLAAIDAYKKAVALAPSNASYQKALSDIYNRLGKWSETMQTLNVATPASAPSKKDASEKALFHMQKAISLEPTNPDYHLALGKLYESLGESITAEKEYKKAVAAYPLNMPNRHFLAMHYILSGRKGDALEQARILANIDDSYVIRDLLQKKYLMEQQPPDYLSKLSRSYLYYALEIAWRASQDTQVIKGIAPNTPDAAQVVQLFIDAKGLSE
ncbi:MAG: tetratricopeptide repeat protein [Deltaproteobacteria bacterium]|nr:tetratricopeptide repeat protein [Deltaproteobacteria bacterium]